MHRSKQHTEMLGEEGCNMKLLLVNYYLVKLIGQPNERGTDQGRTGPSLTLA
jgi:hypothetical protein